MPPEPAPERIMPETQPPQPDSVTGTEPPPQAETYQESLAAADRELRAWLRRQMEQRAQRRHATAEMQRGQDPSAEVQIKS